MTDQRHITFNSTATVTDQRQFSGVAVPYDELTRDGRNIKFSAGSFGSLSDLPLAALYFQHPLSAGGKAVRIGRVAEWTDSPTGLLFSAQLNDTEDATRIYESLKSGDISEVSVGVYINDFSEDENGVTTFSSAEILELSVITDGNSAFAGSKITAVFNEQSTDEVSSAASVSTTKEDQMEDTTNEVAELRADVEELSRSLTVFADQRPSAPAVSKFHSFGAVVKAIAAGDQDAIDEMNAFSYTGGVSADVNIQPKWAAPLLKIVDNGRPVLNLFNKLPDPGTNTIDYLKIDSNTINVAEQEDEGDDLAYGKIDLTSATASMKTYGGWFDWSQQAIDRADVGVVDLGYRALAAKYASVTESVLRVAFLAATGTSVTGFDASDWGKVVDTVVDVQSLMNSRGEQVEFIVSTPDNFKKLAKLDHDGEFILSRNSGSIDIPGIKATLFGLPVWVLASGTGVFTFTNSSALTVWESGVGKLSDSNVVNLTSQFSLYGYMGVGLTNENAIVKAVA